MVELKHRHCKAYSKGMPALSATEVSTLLSELDSDWQYDESDQHISKNFNFKNFYRTMAFVNVVAWVANQEDHHPDLNVSYSNCQVKFSTHSVSGLTENDFICAAKIDAMMNN